MSEGSPTGTLEVGEPHPSARRALEWIQGWAVSDPLEAAMMLESLYSTALSGNRLAEICAETLRRISEGEPVSDRYVLGLAWFLRDALEEENS